jgi:tRNA uridine 5-carboxymethylaminomethyl modification enzyme
MLNKKSQISTEIARLNSVRVGSETLAQMLKRPECNYYSLPSQDDSLPSSVKQSVEFEIKYAGYIARQTKDIDIRKSFEYKQIPVCLDYNQILGLSNEARQKLTAIRPASIGQAARISGVTPADVSLLSVWIKRKTMIKQGPDIQ